MKEILAQVATEQGTKQEKRVTVGETDTLAFEIYSALSNRDSFDIFCLASGGIRAKTKILAEYNFSRKRYYVRLRRLINTGLIKKVGRYYVHTSLGHLVYQTQIKSMELFHSSFQDNRWPPNDPEKGIQLI